MKNAKERIKKQVLEMMRTKYIEDIKVTALTNALGISRGTFYLYYDSTFAVLQEIEDEYFHILNDINSKMWDYPLDPTYLKEPHPVILEALQFLHKERKVGRILWGPYGDPVFQAACKSMIQRNFFPPYILKTLYPQDSEMYQTFLVGGHSEIVTKWIRNDHGISPEKLSVSLYRVMFSDPIDRLCRHGKLFIKEK